MKPAEAEPSWRVGLRPVVDSDEGFLRAVYASTRADELALVDWPDADKAAFVTMQFAAQAAHYREHYPDADQAVIEADGAPVGRLYLDRRADEVRIVDIALLPEARGHGVGAHLLRRVLEEGAARGVPVRIHVERFNRALGLYRRLGFTEIGEAGVYVFMEWTPR